MKAPEPPPFDAPDSAWERHNREVVEWHAWKDSKKSHNGDGQKPLVQEIEEARAEAIRKKEKPPEPTPLLSYDDMVALPEADWAIHGVLPRRAKSVLFG